jgi:hypothetical protein
MVALQSFNTVISSTGHSNYQKEVKSHTNNINIFKELAPSNRLASNPHAEDAAEFGTILET